MSSLSDAVTSQPTTSVKHTTHGDADASNGGSNVNTLNATSSRFTFTPDPAHTSTWPKWPPTTKKTCRQPSERSETPMTLRDGSFDHASSVTLQGEFPWHDVDVHKYPQQIPSTVCPTLFLPASDLSPPSSKRGSREGDADSDASDSDDTLLRYSAVQKGKSKAHQDEDVVHDSEDRSSKSPVDFHFSLDNDEITIQEWFAHNRPLLQDYADRQTSLPLGTRLQVSIDEPSKFILGAFHLLVNRDDPNRCVDPSRQLGPQLIENFVDINRWAEEYFRSRHSAQVVDNDVTALLTIVMNSFFEGQVQLIDRLVELAFRNMRISGRSNLVLQDFAFGFDFKMSHDLPFYVETSSRIRKPVPIRAVQMPSVSEPITTNSGRQVKPTARAQAAAEETQSNANGRRNRARNTNVQFCKRRTIPGNGSARPKKGVAQPTGDSTVQDTSSTAQSSEAAPVPNTIKAAKLERYRPIRPSNLREPPVLPGPAIAPKSEDTPTSEAEEGSKSVTAEDPTSVTVDNASDSATSQQAVQPPHRLLIKLRAPRKPLPASTTTGAAIRDPESSSNDSNNTRTGTDAVETRMLRGGYAWRAQLEGSGPRGFPLDGCGSGAAALSAGTPKATPDATAPQLKSATPEGAGTDETAAPAVVNRLETVQPTTDDGPESGVGADTTATATSTTAPTPAESGVQSHAPTDDGGGLDALNDKRAMRQTVRTFPKRKRPRTPPTTDPENPRRSKKRKLNDERARTTENK